MNPFIEDALRLTEQEKINAYESANHRQNLRFDGNLPRVAFEDLYETAENEIIGAKKSILINHVKKKISERFFKRVERLHARRTGEPFRIGYFNGLAFTNRYTRMLERFMEKEIRKNFSDYPVSLKTLREVYQESSSHASS